MQEWLLENWQLVLLMWLVCGYVAFGFTFGAAATCQCPECMRDRASGGRKTYRQALLMSTLYALLGPFGIPAAVVSTQVSFGIVRFEWKPTYESWRQAG